MSEGGYFPWKTQTLQIAPHLSTKDYQKALPTPPVGFFWERLDDRTWDLKKFDETAHSASSSNCVVFREPSALHHVVMPSDTLAGLSLRYRVSIAEIKRYNVISSNNIQCLKVIKIPIEHGQPVQVQADEKDVVLQRFKNETGESKEEALLYLQENEWNLHKALNSWHNDEAYERTFSPTFTTKTGTLDCTTEEEETRERQERIMGASLRIVQPTRIIFVDSVDALRVAQSLCEASAPPLPLENNVFIPLLASPYIENC